MSRQPGGDNPWTTILEHRPSDQRAAVVERFIENGIGPRLVDAALADMGDALCVAASSGDDTWADAFGGRLAVALLAAEVSAYAAHLNSRASTVRAMAVDGLLDEYSAVTVAARLGVSRQKVYDIGRGGLGAPCTDRTAETIDRTTGESDG